MEQQNKKPVGATVNEDNPKEKMPTQDKTFHDGHPNAGVSSEDEEEQRQIEKKATLLAKQPTRRNSL